MSVFIQAYKSSLLMLTINTMILVESGSYRFASSSRIFTSISFLGWYFGKLDGSLAKGIVVKN